MQLVQRAIFLSAFCAAIVLPIRAQTAPDNADSSGAQSEADDYTASWGKKAEDLLVAWRLPGANHEEDWREDIVMAAVKGGRPEIVEEVALGARPDTLEIPLPAKIRQIAIREVFRFPAPPERPYASGDLDVVIRRMTPDRFEVWTPDRGWLFDGDGDLRHTARVPRRDGRGREWHGAFLPDGRYVTTDLWEMDKTLHFFSREGKWQREVASWQLVPPNTDDPEKSVLIGWARCDRTGRFWIASVGSEGGRGIAKVEPDGHSRPLTDAPADSPWRLSFPRDLEPKGDYLHLAVHHDDEVDGITRVEAGHGERVGFPCYSWGQISDLVLPAGNHDFGFLPHSHDVFVDGSDYGADPGTVRFAKVEVGDHSTLRKTWFFQADGQSRGWLRGAYLGDTADGRGTCYLVADNTVIELSPTLQPMARRQFTIRGAPIRPVKLFPDLRTGLFNTGRALIVARW